MFNLTPIERSIRDAASSTGLVGSVSERFGLMPTMAPSAALPASLAFVDDLVAELPTLFRRGRVCKRLIELPVVGEADIAKLEREEMLRLSMAFGFMTYSFRYAWEHGRERLIHGGEQWSAAPVTCPDDQFAPTAGTISRIRPNVLVPWRQLAKAMGRDQYCFEADFFTRNFRLSNGTYQAPEQVGQDGCELLFRMFANETERTFFLGVQEITAKFNCIPALVAMQRAMASGDHDGVVVAVDTITALWQNVVEDVFMRFDTRIDPAEWAATVGTWTASPFAERDGFSGMFFPAFHMLDVLLGRVRYRSLMGRLITHTRGELLPAWQKLFVAIGEADLRSYCDAHGQTHPHLLGALIRLQDAYQHFFLVHRRKVFAFEYQGIVTGRNSTNAGIAVDIKDRTVESVFSLATWNQIDDLLLESGIERPLERMAPAEKCPFSGAAKLAEDAPKSFPPPVAMRCPFSGATKPPPAPEPKVGAPLPDWRPLASDDGIHGIVLDALPVTPQVGDRVALWLDAEGTHRVEGDFLGPLASPYQVRTKAPITELHRIEVLRGLFARKPGTGARAEHTREAPVLVLAQGRHAALATTLAPHARRELFIVVEGDEAERDVLAARGVPLHTIAITPRLGAISAEDVSAACAQAPATLQSLRDDVLIYISGDPDFVKRANAWIEAAFVQPLQSVTEYLAELRLSKRYRPIVQAGAPAFDGTTIMYPWDVLGARRYPLRVVLGGRVLDLTQFQALHYGGTPILRMVAGTDITAEFSRAHPDGQVNMPEVHTVASFHVPAGLEKVTQLAFIIARSANVLGLLDSMLGPYRNSPRPRTQRLCRVLEALDIETLWSRALAKACGTDIHPGVQQALRANHARSLAVLESTLHQREMKDLTGTFALEYTNLYENVLQNLVRGLRDSLTSTGKIDKEALRLCFDRHIQILLDRNATTKVEREAPSERLLPSAPESTRELHSERLIQAAPESSRSIN